MAAIHVVTAVLFAAVALEPATADAQQDRRRAAGWIEPAVNGTRDSDGTTTWLTGVSLTSSDLGRARVMVSLGRGSAGDALASRGFLDARVGAMLRPVPALSVELSAGAERLDRTFIDTATGVSPAPGGPGIGGPPRAPIGRARQAGQDAWELVPEGRARVVWKDAAGRWRFDGRASRQVLDASPYLVAQAVQRDEVGAEVDLRVAGPMRVRAFGRTGRVHNENESNARRIVGGAIAFAPDAVDISVRAQELSYGGPTGLAYFAPRHVRTAEVTTYFERDIGVTSVALDAGVGAQQVAAWAESPGNWSPTGRAWLQLSRPLTSRVSLGAEAEAYDSSVGADMPSFEIPQGRWRYGSLRMWFRLRM